MILWVAEPTSLAALDSTLGGADAASVREAPDFVFACTHSPNIEEFNQPALRPDRERLLRRVEGRGVYLLSLSAAEPLDFVAWRVHAEGLQPLDDAVTRERARKSRQADLLALARGPGEALFIGTRSWHFCTPAQVHTKVFLRTANLLRERTDLDRLAFWTAPEIARAAALLLDTSSISPIALGACRLARSEAPIDWLPAHPSVSPERVRTTVERLVHEVTISPGRPLAILISVTSTGTVIDAIDRAIRDHGISVNSILWIPLYGFADSPAEPPPLCVIDEPAQNYSPANCALCKEESRWVDIDPRLYYLRIPVDNQIVLHHKHVFKSAAFAEARQFLESFGGKPGVLRVHRDDPNDGRHHAFGVDVVALMEHELARGQFEERVAAIDPVPDLIAAPRHAAGATLAKLAGARLGRPVVLHDTLDPRTLPRDVDIGRVRSLLILDDVVNTGSRMKGYNVNLRERWAGVLRHVSFICAVARTATPKELLTIRAALTTGHNGRESHFDSIFRLPLPRWGSGDCPWCREYDHLTRVSEALPEPTDWLMDRIARLADRDMGMVDLPFLSPFDHAETTLGDNSLLCSAGANGLQTVFAMATGTQIARALDDESHRLQPAFPLRNVLGQRCLDLFEEECVTAALLRATQPSEWTFEARHAAARVLEGRQRGFVLGEWLLHSARGGPIPLTDAARRRLVEHRRELGPMLTRLVAGSEQPDSRERMDLGGTARFRG